MSDARDPASAIGTAVRTHRRARGLSMRDLAARIGTSQPFVSNIENGHIFPSLRTLGLLAEALEVSSDQLLPAPERVDSTNLDAHPRAEHEPASRLLLASPDLRTRVMRVDLAADEREPHPHTHAGEEVVRVMRGEALLLRESEAPRTLTAGDALWLAGEIPHRLHAGPHGVTALVVIAGPLGAHA